jgi:hypothetical protein
MEDIKYELRAVTMEDIKYELRAVTMEDLGWFLCLLIILKTNQNGDVTA